jgi:hypothetical protein
MKPYIANYIIKKPIKKKPNAKSFGKTITETKEGIDVNNQMIIRYSK